MKNDGLEPDELAPGERKKPMSLGGQETIRAVDYEVVYTTMKWSDAMKDAGPLPIPTPEQAKALGEKVRKQLEKGGLDSNWAFIERLLNVETFAREEVIFIADEPPQPKPYKPIRIALLFLASKDVHEALVGDLSELFVKHHEKFGAKVANCWYVKECALSLWPLFQAWLLRIGAISFLYDLWHRMMGK